MSASLCMSMASLAVSGAGRGATVARMGRAATVGKGAVAGSAFMPAKTSAALTMKALSRVRLASPPVRAPLARVSVARRASSRAESSPRRSFLLSSRAAILLARRPAAPRLVCARPVAGKSEIPGGPFPLSGRILSEIPRAPRPPR